jgi:hypothetical protein
MCQRVRNDVMHNSRVKIDASTLDKIVDQQDKLPSLLSRMVDKTRHSIDEPHLEENLLDG